MSFFTASGSANYIAVRDVAAAASWYVEKLGLRKIKAELDDDEDCLALGFSKAEYAVTLGPAGKPAAASTVMLMSWNVKKAREFLNSRGVTVGEIQEDRQGTHYFEMRDLEGNVIEICEEH